MAIDERTMRQAFGGPGRFAGYGTGGGQAKPLPEGAAERFAHPRYHEGEQIDPAEAKNDDDDRPVTVDQLCTHF